MPLALYALTAGAFGIGVTEFVIMGLLIEVGRDLGISIATAGLLISGYALGVVVGAPILTAFAGRMKSRTILLLLMVVFTIGNAACALAPNFEALMVARLVTALAHGTFFGVGSVVATSLVAEDRRASAIAVMFTGLTVANIAGVPLGTWLGQEYGWRMTFWAVAVVGVMAFAVLAMFLPKDDVAADKAEKGTSLSVLFSEPVVTSLAMTVLGFAAVFAVFTFIAPILTQVSGFAETAVSPILLLFGAGLVVGNLLGGRLADRNLDRALILSLGGLGVVLVAMELLIGYPFAAAAMVGLLGAAGFATVAPLQLRILQKARGMGQALASSLNIAAFNLGNAIGAWVGGLTIEHGPGLAHLPIVAAIFPVAAVGLALIAMRREQRSLNAAPAKA
ncbi:MAG: MFS transporter [Alphaproteobacteria bacterium]|nr:MFS transporter [Rhizobiaceae bacterium]MBU3960890.1 MFS transporter [Alphaproteobacteria bacterium]MBU4050103.1 MFS transporter [Alphaproteobacteria bacterium]MBU4091507.1 MFS transporter [Alphaproteobacteria bacterium]MBU4158035.1 MFS transporter [Alphaproteobacteria bacterium]